MNPAGDAIWINRTDEAAVPGQEPVAQKPVGQKIVGQKIVGQKILFWQDGQVVEIWHGEHASRIGTIHAIRIDRLFAAMGRATGKLDDGRVVSVRIGKRDGVEVGQIVVVTITAAPRDGKAWQATIGARLVSENFVFLPDQAGLFTSKSIQSPPPAAVFSALQSLLEQSGGGAILRRNAGMVDTPTLTTELTSLMALWQGGGTPHSHIDRPAMIHDGGSLLAKAQRYAPQSVTIICDTDMSGGRSGDVTGKMTGAGQHRGEDFSAAYDEAVEKASTTAIALSGGGVIWMERTKALTAIDIDSGSGTLDDAISNAPAVIARHLRLRSLTGLIAIDVPRASPAATKRFGNDLGACFDRDPRRPEILGRTRGGVLECRIQHGHAPLADQLADQMADLMDKLQ